MPPPPPIPDKFHASVSSFGSNLSVSGPISPSQVIVLAREAMKTALQDNESQAAEASGVSNELKPGVTIDLSRRNIQELPDEVVDIIKHELERCVVLVRCPFAEPYADVLESSCVKTRSVS
jgi:hypothetical protein